MAEKGRIGLSLSNVYGEPLPDVVDCFLKNMATGTASASRDRDASKPFSLAGLSARDIYRVEVVPRNHRPCERFLVAREGTLKIEPFALAADPARVRGIAAPPFSEISAKKKDLASVLGESDSAEGFEGKAGQQLYAALDDPLKAGLLNIYAKMKCVVLAPGHDAFSYMMHFRRFRGDRFFAAVLPEMRDRVKTALSTGLFREVSGALHTPPPGFQAAGSFKTREPYGNLQITFFSKSEALEFIADVDIDDAGGIRHLFQVLEHSFSGSETHPYDIHEILLQHQSIDPDYRLVFV
jgi:hypothetical protein